METPSKQNDNNGDKKVNNAEHVINAFGGATRLSRLLKIPRSTITTWVQEKPKGSGGRIPDKHKVKVDLLAKKMGLHIKTYINDEKK